MTRSVFCRAPIDHPMIFRGNASMTAAQYRLPPAVGCSVMSVSHSTSGASAANCRLTRSSSVAAFTGFGGHLRRGVQGTGGSSEGGGGGTRRRGGGPERSGTAADLVGFQNSATRLGLVFYAARSY